MQSKIKKVLNFLLAALSVVFIIVLGLWIFQIKINFTPSMPVGLYRQVITSPIKRGDAVSVCLPQLIATEGLRSHYLLAGHCPNGAIPILKEVIALPQDKVCLSNQYMVVNGKKYFAPEAVKDSMGKRVRKFIKNGCYQLQGYWLYGTHDAIHSWDSRYYGEVKQMSINGVYRLIFSF